MYATKEKNRYSECYKEVLYAGPKSARNILTNLSPNPARLTTVWQKFLCYFHDTFHPPAFQTENRIVMSPVIPAILPAF